MNLGCRQFRSLSRRDALSLGGATLFGLTLPDFLRAEEQGKPGTLPAQAKQMVCIWLGGGPPHRDSFDPKPDAPAEFRGGFKTISTNLPGVQFSELLPRMAQVADKCTIIRSCTTGRSRATHGPDTLYWLSANPRQEPITPKYPTYGSVMARLRKAPPEVPPFVALGSGDKGVLAESYLGSAYAPLTFSQQQSKSLQAMLTVPQARLPGFGEDVDLVKAFNEQRRQLDRLDPILDGRDRFQQKAFDLLRSAKMAEALDVKQESAKTMERYGAKDNKLRGGSSACESVLLARRLIEAGVPFVHLRFLSWDMHSDNDGSCRTNFPSLDMAAASLIEDLDERGLLDTTIVAVLGEMGRTPWPQGGKGKGSDHWPTQFVTLAGGGFRRGHVVGATDKHAVEIATGPYGVESFARTIYTQLGINPDHELHTTEGRPLKIVTQDAPLIREALA